MARRKLATVRAANEQARSALAAASSTASSPNHLGDLAWWDPVSSWRREVHLVADAFRDHGVDPDATLPAAPDWPVAFGRAVHAVRTRIRENDYTLIDAKPGPNGERRIAIVRIARGGQVSTDDEGTVTCPKDGASPYVERPDPNSIGQQIVDSAQGYFNRYTSDDIRNAVVETFERYRSLPCRATAPHVVYWVPPVAGDVIRKLADAVESLGWGRIELFAGYANDERSKRACVNAVNEGLEAKLKAFAEQVERYSNTDPSRTRVATIEGKIEEAKELRSQGAFYREILGAAVSSIDDRMTAIESELRRTLGIVEGAHAA